MSRPRVLLTNDDGIDSVGFRALYDALSAVTTVTAVAPAEDRSAVGRSLSSEIEVRDHELGYAITGTPADCVVAGLEVLCPDADLVVAGCNEGANLGFHVLGRSGTVSAAVEATFFDVPGIAASLYVPGDEDGTWRGVTDRSDYREAVRATRYLVETAPDANVFEQVDYLNVNAPIPGEESAPLALTRPSTYHDLTAERDGDRIQLADRIWDRMRDGDIPDGPGTDRRAVFEGQVSVSPLTAPHTTERHDALDELIDAYPV